MIPQAERIACFLHHHARVPALPFPILSAVSGNKNAAGYA
jgi:hypothetical protein